jgi:hypothetical protein
MNSAHPYPDAPNARAPRGFALVATLMLMILLVVIAVGLLSLSAVSLRTSGHGDAAAEARANARLGLMIALGELQKQLGPDTRVSASSSILDQNPETPAPDNVANRHWLGVWDSWKSWLNDEAETPDGRRISIDGTYGRGREPMFRGWLVSRPDGQVLTLDSARSVPNGELATLVGPGSVSEAADHVVVGLMTVPSNGKTSGRHAWWVGGQNQKAHVAANARPTLALGAAEAEESTGDFGTRGLSVLDGLDALPREEAVMHKITDLQQVGLAEVSSETLKRAFHDITTASDGVISDVRWGGLKKDLNLLFENAAAAALPAPYQRGANSAPGPRPLSPDLLANAPRLPFRAFSSFEMMREYYRIYRTADSPVPLGWTGAAPFTAEFEGMNNRASYTNPDEKGFRRMPVFAKYYTIYSLRSQITTEANRAHSSDIIGRYQHDLVHTVAVVLWNPYNVPLVVPSNELKVFTLPYKIFPTQYRGYQNGAPLNANWLDLSQTYTLYGFGGDFDSSITNDDGSPIRFEPGQFRVFSKRSPSYLGENPAADTKLYPGYDPYADFSRRIRIYSNKTNDGTRWGISMRINPLWNKDGTAWWWGGNPGAFNFLGQRGGGDIWRGPAGICYDWTAADLDNALLAPTSGAGLVEFQTGITEPTPFAAVGVSLKTSSLPDYTGLTKLVGMGIMPDYRSKNWMQGLNSLPFLKMNISYQDSTLRELQRQDSPYQLHFRQLNGAAELAELLSRDITNRISHLGSGADGEKVYSVASQELPTAPVTSLAGFAGMPLRPGWYNAQAAAPAPGNTEGHARARMFDNVVAYNAGLPGVGIGNSFATPMIPGNKVYAYHDVSKNAPQSAAPGSATGPNTGSATDALALSDYWDHALLVNDGLWDSWFTSSIVSTDRPSRSGGGDHDGLMERFFEAGETLPSSNYKPHHGGRTARQIITDLKNAETGYLKAAAHMLNGSCFNVNSVSVDAWHVLFAGLRDHAAAYRDKNGQLKLITPPDGTVPVSRFITAIGNAEVEDPRAGADNGHGPAWTGIRFLTDRQLRELARQCVKQVKLRGPFLNMSDFVNRRLAVDETGRSGALQSAIDYDDGAPDSQSINFRYKAAADMITATPTNYPFQPAATGSRFTGAPGYVVQSDLLRPLGNSISVRDDTYIIRAYGEARDAAGNITARAWCEAEVQRMPEYLDGSDAPETAGWILDAAGKPVPGNLSVTNRMFGRKLNVTSFRWLDPNEI